MKHGLIILLTGSLATFGVSLLTRWFLMPDIVPIAWAEEPQPLWAVELAFLLRATELVAISLAVIAFLGIAALIGRRFVAGRGRAGPGVRCG